MILAGGAVFVFILAILAMGMFCFVGVPVIGVSFPFLIVFGFFAILMFFFLGTSINLPLIVAGGAGMIFVLLLGGAAFWLVPLIGYSSIMIPFLIIAGMCMVPFFSLTVSSFVSFVLFIITLLLLLSPFSIPFIQIWGTFGLFYFGGHIAHNIYKYYTDYKKENPAII